MIAENEQHWMPILKWNIYVNSIPPPLGKLEKKSRKKLCPRMLGAQMSLHPKNSIREIRNVEHEGLSLQQKRCIACFLSRRQDWRCLRAWVTPALSVDPTIHRSPKLTQAALDVTNNSVWLLSYLYSQGFPQAGSQIANRLGDLWAIWMTETIQILPLGC